MKRVVYVIMQMYTRLNASGGKSGMRRRPAALLAVSASLLGAMTVGRAEVVYHVATAGDDANPGTAQSPFRTVQRAQEQIRQIRRDREIREPVTVVIEPGVHRLNQPLVFNPIDSGTADAPITYRAARRGETVLSGGMRVRGWLESGQLWKTRLEAVEQGRLYFHQLFADGHRRPRARTPDQGYLYTVGPLPGFNNPEKNRGNPKAKMGFRYHPGDIKRWDNLEDINLFVYHAWTASLHWIDSLDERNHIVRYTARSNWPTGLWGYHQRYVIENCSEALDMPGEWYLNRRNGELTYMPLPGESIEDTVIEIPRLRHLAVLAGEPADGRFVEHLHFDGLSFQHADWRIKDRGRADGQGAVHFTKAAIYAEGARHCRIEDCEVAHVGEYAIDFRIGCRNNLVRRCHMHDLGAGGVRIGDFKTAKMSEVETGHHLVDNCFIHNGGQVFPAGVGVLIAHSSHNTVSHNEIRDLYYTGVSVGWVWGYGKNPAHHNRIEFNHIHDIGKNVLSDMGGVYLLGVSPGTVVRNNVIHHVYARRYGGWGLYTDQGSSDILMENNLVYRTSSSGFNQTIGKENVIRNNIFAFARRSQIEGSRDPEKHLSFTLQHNIVYSGNGWMYSPKWTDFKSRVDHNCYWDTCEANPDFAGMTFEQWRRLGYDRHSIIADPGFVDAPAYDFRLEPDSPALTVGFEPFDPAEAGLYGDAEWTSLPERTPYDPFEFPPPPLPAPLAQGFEDLPLGAHPPLARVADAGTKASVAVCNTEAAGGVQSLEVVDKPDLPNPWEPYLYYEPGFCGGIRRGRFSLYRMPGSRFRHEWRDAMHPCRTGVSLCVLPDGKLLAGERELMNVPEKRWIHFDIACDLGGQADRTYDLTVAVDGEPIRRFDDLPLLDDRFRRLHWWGFIAEGQQDARFYIDDLRLE